MYKPIGGISNNEFDNMIDMCCSFEYYILCMKS